MNVAMDLEGMRLLGHDVFPSRAMLIPWHRRMFSFLPASPPSPGPSGTDKAAPAAEAPAAAPVDAVKSPMVGTAYLAPEPGAANFVDVGTTVKAGQTLLIVEAMPGQGLLQTLGVLLLAASSIVIIWLCFATVRGLRDGTLLAPEPVATITPTAA